MATEIEYADACVQPASAILETLPPQTVRGEPPTEYWELSLEEIVQIGLANSKVMRDLGGRVVTAPNSVVTTFDPALSETNPRLGPEAALSAFDTQFNTSVFWNRNERSFNNPFIGAGASSLAQNTSDFRAELSKTAATGTRFAARSVIDYDRSNSPANVLNSVYNAHLETEFIHPLLQGSGLEFNRIAGPNASYGSYNGVLIGRINTDISLADFETGVRDLLTSIEEAYWELYFAYRTLESTLAGRQAALETWRSEQLKLKAGTSDGEREALAREQYYTAQAAVENALSGNITQGLVVSGGVYGSERTLRLLLGLPASDGRVIRPLDEPSTADVIFSWEDSLQLALWRRVELRRQQWQIKKRELELIAAKNFLKMRLDLVGQYRWRGFGDDLLGSEDQPNGSAFGDLINGDLQEWQLGLQLSTPVGNRLGHLAVRNAELQLSRERAIYREQENQIVHQLSTAVSEVDRALAVSRSNYNRTIAARQQHEAVVAKYEAGQVLLEFVLDAQQRAVLAGTDYYRSLVDHNLAIAKTHQARGTYLDYLGVQLSEGPWSQWAHCSAAERSMRYRRSSMNYCFDCHSTVSRGSFPQLALEQGETISELAKPRKFPLDDPDNPHAPEPVPDFDAAIN